MIQKQLKRKSKAVGRIGALLVSLLVFCVNLSLARCTVKSVLLVISAGSDRTKREHFISWASNFLWSPVISVFLHPGERRCTPHSNPDLSRSSSWREYLVICFMKEVNQSTMSLWPMQLATRQGYKTSQDTWLEHGCSNHITLFRRHHSTNHLVLPTDTTFSLSRYPSWTARVRPARIAGGVRIA